ILWKSMGVYSSFRLRMAGLYFRPLHKRCFFSAKSYCMWYNKAKYLAEGVMNHLGTKTLETERLILRKFKLTDVKDMYYNWANDDDVTRHITWATHNNMEVTEK